MVQEFHYLYHQEIIVFSHAKNSSIMDFYIITAELKVLIS